MARTLKFAVLAAALMLCATVVGASAFTSTTIERTSTITVQDDEAGKVKLAAGPVSGVDQNSDGELEIELTKLNNGATFVYGQEGDKNFGSGGTAEEAFSITAPTEGPNLEIEYAGLASDSDHVLQFEVYKEAADGSTTLDGSFNEDGDKATLTAGNTYYVILTVDTNTLNANNGVVDLSGTVKITTAS